MRDRHRGLIASLLLIACALAGAAHAEEDRLPLWRLDGESNRVYLLGSVHLLRESDYPIPAPIYDAYEDAETLVMELDMDDLDTAEAAALVRELGVIEGDTSLEALLGPAAFAKASGYAAAADIPLQTLAHIEPWFAAVTVEQMMLVRVGFDPGHGIEAHLAQRAAEDRKEILGLETMRQQFELLDSLSLDAQTALLLQSLEDSLEIGAIMDDMVRAWRHGDIEYLEDAILDDMQQHAELYRALVVTRNRSWATQIDALLSEADDYLVVVGTLHLVGADGLPAILRDRGRNAVQLSHPRP